MKGKDLSDDNSLVEALCMPALLCGHYRQPMARGNRPYYGTSTKVTQSRHMHTYAHTHMGHDRLIFGIVSMKRDLTHKISICLIF